MNNNECKENNKLNIFHYMFIFVMLNIIAVIFTLFTYYI